MTRTPASQESRRRGTSLVEALAMIAIGGVLLGAVSASLTALYALDRRLGRAAEAGWGESRLPEQLQQDVWAASRTEWDGDQQRLTLAPPDGVAIVYQFEPGRCRRSTEEGESGQGYRLPGKVSVAVAPEAAAVGETVTVSLTVAQRPGAGAPSPAPLRLVVGRDQQLLHE